MQNDIQLQIEQIKSAWDSSSQIPQDMSGLGFPGLTKQAISDSLGGLAEIALQLANDDKFEPSPTSKAYVTFQMTQLRAHAIQHVPSNPQPHIPGLLMYLEYVRSAILNWVSEADLKSNRTSSKLSGKLADIVSKMHNAEILYKQITSNQAEIKELSKQASEDALEVGKLKASATAATQSISLDVAATKKIATEAANYSTVLENNEEEFSTLTAELEKNRLTQIEIFSEFEGYKKTIEDRIGAANRLGMAGSFNDRKKELNLPIAGWFATFVLSLLLLAEMAGTFGIGHDTLELQQLLLRLPLSAPLVWLAWFAARQYGYLSRLQEDYAFKAKSAMAFEGYKREASGSGRDMQDKLLGVAIENFGENPLRIYSGQGNHASPLHEILERSLKDEKVTDLIKAIIAKIKN